MATTLEREASTHILPDALLYIDGQMRRGDEELRLGSAEIRVFGREEGTYAAPDLIYHYVVDHHYLPPEEFIKAYHLNKLG